MNSRDVPTWTVRRPHPEDAEGWVEVSWNRWADTYGHHLPADYFSPERRERWVAGWRAAFEREADPDTRRGSRLALAESSDGIVVGIAHAGAPSTQGHPGIENARELELNALYIAAHLQGTGLAQALAEAVIGSEPAQLWVSADNARAQAFYRRIGFAPDGASGRYADLIPEIRMVR